jgi:ribonuclease P protein component
LLGHIAPNGLDNNRIGISISAKALPKSAHRNRLKRLIREAYRRNKRKLHSGFDIVIRTKKITAPLSLTQVENDLLHICKKGHILK